MYIILRGGVDVTIKKTTSYGKIIQYVVTSLYDGQHFGDLSMMTTYIKNYRLDKPNMKS